MPLVSGRIYVTNDKIVCGSREGTANVLYPHSGSTYIHPTEKQCNYTPDLSSYATKEELEEVKGMIDMGAKIVGTGNASFINETEITVPTCDYVEIMSEPCIDDMLFVDQVRSVIYKGSTINAHMLTSTNSGVRYSHIPFSLNSTGKKLTVDYNNDQGIPIDFNWIAYKYN